MKTRFKNRRQAEQEQVLMDVNMTPLIDVMLVLIIMLIISIPIQQHAINMLNPASSAQQQPPATPVSIDILQHGQLRWNGQPLAASLLESRFKALTSQPAPYEVRIRPAPASDYKDMTMVLAAAQRQGISNIGLYE